MSRNTFMFYSILKRPEALEERKRLIRAGKDSTQLPKFLLTIPCSVLGGYTEKLFSFGAAFDHLARSKGHFNVWCTNPWLFRKYQSLFLSCKTLASSIRETSHPSHGQAMTRVTADQPALDSSYKPVHLN